MKKSNKNEQPINKRIEPVQTQQQEEIIIERNTTDVQNEIVKLKQQTGNRFFDLYKK